MDVVAVIPARMASSRFPGKPLAPLQGLPMIEHVFRRVKLCSRLDDVYVATCDEEIRALAEGFGAKVIMTSAAHERATDRVAEATEHFAADIIVMVQGDEPMITPEMIQTALEPFRSDSSVSCVNLVHRITSQQEFIDPNTIKVVADLNGNALYFSRSPIPHVNFEDSRAKIFNGSVVFRSCSSHMACRCAQLRDSSTISQSYTRRRRAQSILTKVAKLIGYLYMVENRITFRCVLIHYRRRSTLEFFFVRTSTSSG